MNEGDFGFAGWKIVKFFARDFAEVMLENAWIFGIVAGAASFVGVETEVIGTLCDAKNVNAVVFEG